MMIEFGDLISVAVGVLFGGRTAATSSDDEYYALRAKMDDAVARGWRSALYNEWPKDAEKIWIWRVEWDFPSLVDPRALAPAMNMNQLLWKPWRESDSGSAAPLEIADDRME